MNSAGLARSEPLQRRRIKASISIEKLSKDDSLAENMQRAALLPLDQSRAFVALRVKEQGDEEIAAALFITPQVLKQRLKLAAVPPLPCSIVWSRRNSRPGG